jgi:hypothetical protein
MIYILATFYATWILLTCAYQFTTSKVYYRLIGIDILQLLPLWTFFAPNPGVCDYHLLMRTRRKDGSFSSFEQINLKPAKKLVTSIWNPHKRAQKSLSDYVQEIIGMINNGDVKEDNKHQLKLNLSYISILNYCSSLKKSDHELECVQFMILESYGYKETQNPRLILNSEFHQL